VVLVEVSLVRKRHRAIPARPDPTGEREQALVSAVLTPYPSETVGEDRCPRVRVAQYGSWQSDGGAMKKILLLIALRAYPAVRLYRLATDQGDAPAQDNLGVMYANGKGLPENDLAALMWFNLAATQGNDGAREERARIEQTMTRVQIADAQRLSREWIASHPPDSIR
jgi:hypothetical protein